MPKPYKIILVDDEDEVRGRIASQIDKEQGFEIVGKAGNGHDALELIEELRPDIVLTDIKMPFIDGIELTRIVRREYPMIRVAFITGYDEFNYAQEAVDLRVVKYLMKPVTSEEINTFLSDLKESLDIEHKEKQDLLIVQEQYESLIPLIGDSLLSSLIYSSEINEQQLDKLLLYGIEAKHHQGFQTCFIQIDRDCEIELTEIEKIKLRINEMIKVVFSETSFIHNLMISEGLVFVFTHGEYTKNEIDTLLLELVESIKEYVKVGINIGVSSRYENFISFPASYSECKRAIGYASKYDFSEVVYFDEIDNLTQKSIFIDIPEYRSYDQLLQFGDKNALIEAVHKMRQRINEEDVLYNLEFIKVELSSLIIYLTNKADVSVSDITEQHFLDVLQNAADYNQLFDIFESLLLAIMENDIRKQLSRSEKLTQEAMSFIENNYQNSELTLDFLSSKLNVSFSHLSMLFKKHSGYTFSSYLIKVRMDKAKEMLSGSNLRIIDIANLCGYSDVYYFSHSFKKYTGLSPKRYREQ